MGKASSAVQHQVWVRFSGIGVVGAVFTDTGFKNIIYKQISNLY